MSDAKLASNAVSVTKIGECRVLAGAARVLATTPDVCVEVHAGGQLERLGGSVALVLSYFPRDRYTLLARTESEPAFRPVLGDVAVPSGRFFLVALGSV